MKIKEPKNPNYVGQVVEIKVTGSIEGKNINGHFKNIRIL